MLVHIGQADVASRVHNAWLRTIEDGIHTYDIYEPDTSTSKVGTTAFAASVIDRLGQEPTRLPATHYAQHRPITVKLAGRSAAAKTQLGVDVFVHSPDTTPDELAAKLRPFAAPLHLDMISNRGQKVWPGGAPETLLTDHWRCRFLDPRGTTTAAEVVALQARMVEHGIEPIKTEGLYAFDGEPAFTRGQGQ